MEVKKKDNVVELPGMKGPGVAPVTIPEVNKHARQYIIERDKRCAMTPREVAAKGKLIEALHKNADKIGRDKDGTIVYRFDDNVIVLKPGKEKLQVKSAGDDGEED